MNKAAWLRWAEVIDSFRIIPRAFFIASFVWTISVTHTLLEWYIQLPKDERGVETSGFASAVFLTVTGFLKLVYDTYSKSSRDWNSQPMTSQTVVATSTTTAAK
jgi:hypothetical protein